MSESRVPSPRILVHRLPSQLQEKLQDLWGPCTPLFPFYPSVGLEVSAPAAASGSQSLLSLFKDKRYLQEK